MFSVKRCFRASVVDPKIRKLHQHNIMMEKTKLSMPSTVYTVQYKMLCLDNLRFCLQRSFILTSTQSVRQDSK